MRPLKAYIHLRHLIDNYLYLKHLHGSLGFAVIKADAYGHGAVKCAQALQQHVDGFAVGFLEEAIELRNCDIVAPIVLLQGVFCAREYQMIDEYQLIPVIQNSQQLQWFLNYSWNNKIDVWIKLDTGMRRSGFMPTEFKQVVLQLRQHPRVVNIIDMTHFACADEFDSSFTNQQFENFIRITQTSGNLKSTCNSAGVLYHPDTYQNISRIGIAMYGINPITNIYFDDHLKPVMSLHSEIVSVRNLEKGESIGYGALFVAPYGMRVGLVACGYADGYPSVAQNNPVRIDGINSRIVGRVSMDMLSVELRHESHGIGSQVELWGEHISVNEIALRAHTISYELLCRLKRADKIYTQ